MNSLSPCSPARRSHESSLKYCGFENLKGRPLPIYCNSIAASANGGQLMTMQMDR